jgi:hypothetical protein
MVIPLLAGRVAIMRITPPRPSTRAVIVPVTEPPPATIAVAALTVKLQVSKVGMAVLFNKPGIVLVETVKVQDAKVAIPLAVWPPGVVSVNGAVTVPFAAVVGVPVNLKVSGVLAGIPVLKLEPSGMVNG